MAQDPEGAASPAHEYLDGVRPGDGWPDAAERRRSLERFLLSDSGSLPSVATLRRARLEGYAYASLAATHPQRPVLEERARMWTVRHMAVRGVIARLVGAWRDVGIESLVFKGFHLAEFVFASPSARPYSDVDLLIRPEHADLASDTARTLGFEETWSVLRESSMFDADSQNRPPGYAGHELINLEDPRTGIRIDVHRRIVHNELPLTSVQERITRMVWSASADRAWTGTRIRIPAPVDAVIVGMALHRAWGRDEWFVKPSDYVDFAAVVERHKVTAEDLLRRADELGCGTTFRLFLRRCDPIGRRLDLTPPTWWDRLVWGAQLVPERGHPGLELALVRALDGVVRGVEAAWTVPSVLRAWNDSGVSEAGPGSGPKTTATERAPNVLTHREWSRLQRAVKRVSMLFGRYDGSDDPRFVAALALALRARGVPAHVALGGPDAMAAVEGRARLEVDGRRVPIAGSDGPEDGKPASADT